MSPKIEKLPSNSGSPDPVAGKNHIVASATWAVAARVLYVLTQLALVAILAWMSDPQEVGVFILALAVTGPAFMLANLQLRVVLTTDTLGEFSVASYRQLRLLTATATFFCIYFASTWIVDSVSTQLVFCAVALVKAIESVSDIHIGLLERNEQFSVSSRSLMLRGIFSLTAFSGSYYLWHNLAVACASIAFAWLVVLLLYDLRVTKRLVPVGKSLFKKTLRPSFDTNEIVSLAKRAWPLGLATMIMSLQVSFPRLWTGHLFGFQALGIFGILFQVAVAGQVIGNAFCSPLIPRIAKLHRDQPRQYSYSVYAAGIIAALGICLGGFLLITLRPLLQAVVGAQYASDILLSRIACAIVPIYFVQTVLASVLRAKRRFVTILICEAGALAVLAGISVVIGKDLGLVGPAFAMFLAQFGSAMVYLMLLIWDGIQLATHPTRLQSTALRHRYAA